MGRLKLPRLPLYIYILVGMVLGVIFGIISFNGGFAEITIYWIKPFGEVFMRMLKCIAIPLVLVSLIRGVAGLGAISSLSRMGIKTFVIYVCTTIVAIVVGVIFVELIAPGQMIGADSVRTMQETYHSTAADRAVAAQRISEQGPLQWIVDMVPENVVGTMAVNSNMLQIIFIALLVGVASLIVGREKSAPFIKLIDSINDIIMVIINIVMKFAPIGVFALMAGMIVDNAGDIQLLSALAMYVVTVVLGLFTLILGFYPLLVKMFTKVSVLHFVKKIFPVQLLAFTTSSSAATLPVTMETVERDLGVSNKTASFVLPVGITINMDGTALYQAVGAIFIAQVLGVNLDFAQVMTIIATTTISSIGTPGVPGGSIVILVMVLGSVGIPAEGLALIMGLDRPLDMLRTAVNVTGDATVCMIVDNKDEE